MSPDGPAITNTNTNIRVFVRWHEQVVFAGEELKCTITFKNVARPPGSSSSPSASASSTPTTVKPSSSHFPPNSSRHPNADHRGPRQPSPLHPGRGKPNPSGLAPPAPNARGHRSSLSLSVPSAASRARAGSGSASWSPAPGVGASAGARGQRNGGGSGGGSGSGSGHGHGHKRSVSIVSIGSLSTVDDGQGSAPSPKPQRPRGHARASSLQILPRGGLLNGPRSATHPRIPSSQSSPLFHASYPPERSINGRRPGTATAPETPRAEFPRRSPTSPNPLAEFRFPMSPSPTTPGTVGGLADEDPMSPTSSGLPTRTRELVPTINEQGVAPAARVLSTMSIAGTPRSSGEFYSLSNNSSETLASEYVTQQPLRSQARSPHNRRTSNLASSAARLPESLMMGYAQVQGSFTLDGSLINLGPFEAVKRKAVVGGQGGGVIGLETPKRDSGLLRGFGWGNITSSIGELLGAGELSSIKEMRGIANSKAVPLLSTPQSILFVDLQLGPGESKAYEYSFRLPKGLPPTHRGKAMKISYSLVIGTQRPGGAKEQRVKSVDVPFRVLGSVNSHGEILGHDLMSPYILLRDQARVQTVATAQQKPTTKPPPPSSSTSTMSSFITYVDDLLSRPQHNPHQTSGALLSPSAPLTPHSPTSSRRPSLISVSDYPFLPPPTAKEAIDLAILRANFAGGGSTLNNQSPNRFEIARNGRRVGVVMLTRPAYRLGEAVICVVDFAGAEVQCYAVHAALETAEKVDASLALRSEASVNRVTRKVWASGSEATLFARRWVFSAGIPVGATPEFVTSGVGLEWKVRLEFVVPVQQQQQQQQQQQVPPQVQGAAQERGEGEEGEEGEEEGMLEGEKRRASSSGRAAPHPLLEEISRDEKGGLVLVGVENLMCESFEVAVPLRVYGAACNGLERLERDEAMEEGLPV
ncbi:Rgp1-domain-containing protein [Parachaetomium inaequale]|uniref:Rgp1-domain-containing protein n=1 Tax=Parachaetomium inaequale TaxID=2588326 RepID=A0AAN6SQR4_9PEZI|nr:Rgp1-domain-containing protein [Parachaetomium inaequale]